MDRLASEIWPTKVQPPILLAAKHKMTTNKKLPHRLLPPFPSSPTKAASDRLLETATTTVTVVARVSLVAAATLRQAPLLQLAARAGRASLVEEINPMQVHLQLQLLPLTPDRAFLVGEASRRVAHSDRLMRILLSLPRPEPLLASVPLLSNYRVHSNPTHLRGMTQRNLLLGLGHPCLDRASVRLWTLLETSLRPLRCLPRTRKWMLRDQQNRRRKRSLRNLSSLLRLALSQPHQRKHQEL